eukprot:2728941-Prymnesium_polylepis.1
MGTVSHQDKPNKNYLPAHRHARLGAFTKITIRNSLSVTARVAAVTWKRGLSPDHLELDPVERWPLEVGS